MRLLIFILLALTGIAFAQQPLIYTALVTDVPPQIVAGRTFVPVRAISETFGATVSWIPAQRVVLVQYAGRPDIRLTINSRTAQVNSTNVTLDAAPFITQGRTMVPLRFIAETANVPIEYNVPTRSVRLVWQNRFYVLPLESMASGVVIGTPLSNALVSSPILVQGQGNVYEGNLEIEVRDQAGTVLGRTIATAGMGGFYPFSTTVNYTLAGTAIIDGRIVVFSRNGRGTGETLAEASVPVRLSPTTP